VRWRHGEQEPILADTEDPATAFHRGQVSGWTLESLT
jgi:hypothetical protein